MTQFAKDSCTSPYMFALSLSDKCGAVDDDVYAKVTNCNGKCIAAFLCKRLHHD